MSMNPKLAAAYGAHRMVSRRMTSGGQMCAHGGPAMCAMGCYGHGGEVDSDNAVDSDSDVDYMAKGGEAKLGSGARFAKLSHSLAHKPGVYDPKGLAAAIGRKKYGSAKMSKLAEHGKKMALGGEIDDEAEENDQSEPWLYEQGSKDYAFDDMEDPLYADGGEVGSEDEVEAAPSTMIEHIMDRMRKKGTMKIGSGDWRLS